jgi:signal transduction histidine kinase
MAGYGAYRLGWLQRSRRLSRTLLGAMALSALLTLGSVWAAAVLMFVNTHDLLLAAVLLLYAGGITTAFGYLISMAVTERIAPLERAAHKIAEGELQVRVAVQGHDEVATLAQAFNAMAQQLEGAARRQHQVETLRRNLVAWIGHDLHTPLAAMQAMIEALDDGMVQDEATRRRYLHNTLSQIQNLSLLLQDLREMAEIDAGGLELDCQPASLCDLISDTIEAFTALARQQEVSLAGRCDSSIDPVEIDVPRIGRVLGNLVENALRHTPAGGRVWIQAAREKDGTVRVEVGDTGEGIAADDLAHVFEQFYRGDRSRGHEAGAGLGLAIALGIVEAHDGRIDVDSEPGQGTRVWFTLPHD